MDRVSGIDVSYSQGGNIDWAAVKAAGYKFAFIRLGWAGYDGKIIANGGLDKQYHRNMMAAEAAGMDVGVYVYAYTKDPAAARVAAAETIELVKPYKLTYPIAFDVEESTDKCLINQGKDGLALTIKAYLDTIEAGGYYGMLYTYTAFSASYLNMAKLTKYDLWVADYRNPGGEKCPYPGNFGIWQHGVIGTQGTKGKDYWITGNVPGVPGNCDVNYSYRDYPAIIRAAGLNRLTPSQPAATDYEKLYRASVSENTELKKQIRTLANRLLELAQGD